MTVEVNCLPHDWVTKKRKIFGALLGHTCIDLKIAHYAPVLKGYTSSQSAVLRKKIYPRIFLHPVCVSQRLTPFIIINHTPPYFVRQSPTKPIALMHLTRLYVQQTSDLLVAAFNTMFTGTCLLVILCGYWASKLRSLILTWQVLYQLSHFPSPAHEGDLRSKAFPFFLEICKLTLREM